MTEEAKKKRKRRDFPVTGKGKSHHGALDANRIAFCEGILAGKALYRSYEEVPGWASYGSDARASASHVSKEPEVQAYLAARRLELMERTNVTPERVIEEMARIAFYDPAELVAMKITKPEDIAELPEHIRRVIVGWKWDKFGNLVLTLADKMNALDKLAKHLGLYQADAPHFAQSPQGLLATVLWRYIISAHVHKGMTVAEAHAYALRNPEEVEDWGKEVGLTGGGPKPKMLTAPDEELVQDAVVIEEGGEL